MKAAVSLSLQLSIPKIVIGMTVVSFATSAPELIVSVQSALAGYPDLALGMWLVPTLLTWRLCWPSPL